MGLYDWVCRTLCTRQIAEAAERLRREQEQELEEMKTEAARRADPEKIVRHATRALDRLSKVGIVAALFTGCASFVQLDPRAQRAADVFDCYVAAVEPYLGGVCDVAELVREAVSGRANVPQALTLLGASADDLRAVDAALAACRGAPEAPLVNPRTLAYQEPPAEL